MAGASHAAISQKNMAELLLTKPELEAAAPALQALQEHCGPEFVRNLLTGCYVRIRRNKQPCLSRLMGLHIGPEGKQLLWIEYAKGGRQQLVQCMQELTAAGQVPGIDMTAAGAAVWRKKVLLAWGSHWEEYVAQCGINKLVADLQDTGKMAREATFLEPMPPPQPHPQEQPLPALEQNQQAHQPALPAGAPTEQQPAQQPAVQAPLLSHPQAQQQQAQQQQAQQQPIEPLHGQPLAAQPLQPQMALQVQPGAMQLMQQQGVQVSAVQLPQAPVRSGMFEQQQFQQQPLQRALSHQQQPDSPDLPPHLQQSRPAQPVMAPQPMGQLPPREPNVRPETYMQQHLQAPEPLPLAMPPHMQPAGQQPVPAGRAGSWDAPAAEQPRQAVPMRRHPGLAPVAAHPALPPIHMRQHSLPHVPHGRQMAAHNARTGLLPLSISGPARVMDLRCAEQGQLSPRGLSPRMPAGGLPLSQLHAYGLPPGSLHGQVATFFRRFYPSVHSAKVVEAASGVPHHAIIHFGAVWERDAARSRMNGCLFEGWPLTVRLPDEPLALPLQQAQHGPLEFKAYVNGLPPSMDEASVAAFFRRKYPSVLEVRLWPPARDQPAPSVQRGHVFFTEEGERDAAVREMNGQFLEGQKLKVQLPLDEQAALGVQSSRSPQQQRRPRDYSMYVDGLPPNSTDQSVADLFRQRYPSVISARVRPPTTAQLASGSVTSRRAFVNFATQGERDAALEMNGTFVGGQALRVELPWAEQRPLHPAGQPAAAPNGEPAAAPAGPEDRPPLPAGPQFKLFVVNVGNALSADGLYAYFRERYPSVLSAALRDGHGSVTFGSDVERQRAKVEMDGHVLVGGRKIGTGLPEDTAAQPVPDAPAAAAAAAAAPAQPTPPAASAGHAAPPMANGSAQVGAVGGAPTEASPTSALSGPLASAPPQAPALPAGQAGAALPAVEQHQGAAPGAAAAVPAGLAAGQAPAAAAAPQAEAGMSATVAIGQLPAAAAAAAVPAGLGPLQLVGWPAAGMPGGPFVLVPAAAVAAGEGQPQLVAIPDSGASSAGLFHSPSAGMLLPAQQLATAAATAAPAGSSHQHQPGSGIGPSGLQQGSAQAKQESGAGSHPLDGKAEQASKERVGGGSQLCSGRRSSQRRQGHSRSPARHKDRSRSPARRKDRSRSPARHKERSRSPARRKDRSRSPARRKELSRSPPRRKDRSRSPVHHKRRSRSPARRARSRSPVRRARSRTRDRRRSPDERRRRHSSTRRDDRRSHGQDRGASSRQQQHSRERSSKDRKRQFSPHREADARRQRQRTPERAQQATADQRAAKPAAGPPSPGVVTADSPGTRLVVVHRRQRQGTPDVAATPDRAATPDVAAPPDVAATPEPDVQPGTAAAGADIEEVAEEDAGTPDLASFPELAWDAVDVEAEMGAAAEPQQQVQQQVQQQPCGNGTAEEAGPAAGRPSSPTAHVPAEQLWDPQAGSSMDMSASPPPPASPSRPSSAQPPPLPPSRPCSAVPPLPSEPAAVNISPIAVADPGAVGGGIFAGPPGFGLPSAPGGQGWAAPGWAADPDPLGAGGQPHHLHPPAPFLAPPEGPLPPHLRRPDVPSVPAWVCRLFMDAAREMAEARGLPLDVRDVEVRMDRLCRRQFCLREAGVSMADVCRLMEMREQCDLRHTARGLFITALR